MRYIFLCFYMVSILNCTFSSRPWESEWQELQNAGDVECNDWPQKKEVLGTLQVSVFNGMQTYFLANEKLRNSSSRYSWINFSGSGDLDVKQLVPLTVQSSAVIGGFGKVENEDFVVLGVTNKKDSWIELRNIKTNTVQYKTEPIDAVFQTLKAIFTKSGIWLFYQSDGNVALEEQKAQLIFMPLQKVKSSIKTKRLSQTFDANAVILPLKEKNQIAAVWLHRTTHADQPRFTFKVVYIDENFKVSEQKDLELPINNDVESWSATIYDDHIYIAYVDGDSLVGQATFKVAQIKFEDPIFSVNWLKTRILLNEHVTDPLFVSNSLNTYVLMSKWVDSESTIAVYKLGSQGIENSSVAGIFKKGSIVTQVFSDYGNGDIYAVVRSRQRYGWHFEICKLEDI